MAVDERAARSLVAVERELLLARLGRLVALCMCVLSTQIKRKAIGELFLNLVERECELVNANQFASTNISRELWCILFNNDNIQ